MAIQELGVILNFFKSLEIIKDIPEIPNTKQSRHRTINELLSDEDQKKVISLIDDKYYRDMIDVLAIYALRPGDLRALKWKDVNFQDNTFTIDEHYSKSKLKSGRKSTEAELILPMTDRFIEIISGLPS